MDIQKGKVQKNCEWSEATQRKLASMLGVSALLSLSGATLSACDLGPNTTSGAVELSSSSEGLPPESGVIAEPQPTCGELPCDGEYPPSSSSVKLDSLDVTSGEIVPPLESSSSSYDYPPQAGILPPPPEPQPEAGSPIDQFHDFSSSSQAEQSSSSEEPVISEPGDPVVVDTVPLALAGIIAIQPEPDDTVKTK